MTDADVELCSVTRRIAARPVVDDVSASIAQGQFVSILGPSGCGKTTTLNMIAGFDRPSSGQILIRGRDQANTAPERRNIGLVFQNYALFPHMTIAANVGFGLRMQRRSRADIEAGVRKALKSVRLEGLEERYPKELSGGQQQRVAIARALAPSPSVLLLDEPLSNLDLKLREAMRVELKEIQQQLGMTFIYVTHDQEEALAMSDRIIVMNKGKIAQQGIPSAIYARPASSFVADFIGKSNILELSGKPRIDRAGACLELGIAGSSLSLLAIANRDDDPAKARFCCIRPEAIRLRGGSSTDASSANRLTGMISKLVNTGSSVEVRLTREDGLCLQSVIRPEEAQELAIGTRVDFEIPPHSIRLLNS